MWLQSMSFDFIKNYWGKTNRKNGDELRWHPLAYHCLDVAASAWAYMEVNPTFLENLAKLSGFPIEETKKRVLISAALHDLGKFANNFQYKCQDLANKMDHKKNVEPVGHGDAGRGILEEFKDEEDFEDYYDALEKWCFAAFSHHGVPVEVRSTDNLIDNKELNDAKDFINSIIRLFGEPSNKKPNLNNNTQWLVAGIIIISDWIGSNVDFFPYDLSISGEPDKNLEEYWEYAKEQAEIAFKKINIANIPIAENLDIKDLLGDNAQASPLQKWAQEQEPNNEPQLYIIEDLTGAGKTEAAFLLAHKIMKAGAADGIYWALPSQASANSLYDRFSDYYKKLYKGGEPSLVLAHSARDINDTFKDSITKGEINEYGGGGEQNISAEASCSAFIADDRKKTFLAHFGIGTLDQALLGVLPVKHQALRLLGLSRRVLVVDEAHSYDDYVNKGLQRLLNFQRALGGSTIILSATLTKKQKENFAKSYAKGEIKSEHFPLLTKVTLSKNIEEIKIEASRGTRRDLPINRVESPEIAESKILEIAKQCNCVLYIRNSVAEAIETYERLKAQWDKAQLFHARFCLGDRNEIETKIVKQFGKNSTNEEREGQILISTQVTEQSLDLSFDYMFTDLAPIDLLIQRAGRLQRHKRENMPKAVLNIVSSGPNDDIKESWISDLFKIGQYVYPDHGQLWKTIKILEEKGGINLESSSPRDLIEPVFDDDKSFPPALNKASDNARAKNQAMRGIANLNFLEFADGFKSNDNWQSENKTPTRLGEETIIVQLGIWENGVLKPFFEKYDFEKGDNSWRYSQMQISKTKFLEAIAPNDEAKKALDDINALWKKRYDPPPIIIFERESEDSFVAKIKQKQGKSEIEARLHYSKLLGLQFISS